MKGRKLKKDAVRRGGHVPAPVELVAEVVPAGALAKPDSVAVNPVMSRCWDDMVGAAPGFEPSDAPLLEAYCYWFAVFEHAMNSTMSLDGSVTTLVAPEGADGEPDLSKARPNPDLKTAEKATNMLRQLGDALNISPTARVRTGLMRAMTASTQADVVSKTVAGFQAFQEEQKRLNAAQ